MSFKRIDIRGIYYFFFHRTGNHKYEVGDTTKTRCLHLQTADIAEYSMTIFNIVELPLDTPDVVTVLLLSVSR